MEATKVSIVNLDVGKIKKFSERTRYFCLRDAETASQPKWFSQITLFVKSELLVLPPLTVPIKQKVIEEFGEFGFVVYLFEELEVGINHILNVIVGFVIKC